MRFLGEGCCREAAAYGACASSINNFDIKLKLINFNLKKINIQRMVSEIPTNLLIISNFHLMNPDIMYRYNHIMVDELKNLKLQ